MRHFETKKEAIDFAKAKNKIDQRIGTHVFRKLKGHKNRVKKPFVAGTEMEWLNLN